MGDSPGKPSNGFHFLGLEKLGLKGFLYFF